MPPCLMGLWLNVARLGSASLSEAAGSRPSARLLRRPQLLYEIVAERFGFRTAAETADGYFLCFLQGCGLTP